MINFTRMLLNKGGVSHSLHKEQISLLVVWNITRRCNLKCKHCYISADENVARQELSLTEAKGLIDSLVKVNTGVLLFSGGEPLLRPDIWELAEYARSKGIRCGLSTNGTLISEEIARKLKDHGIIYAGISIDGDRLTHDSFRGARSFEQALEGVRNCKKAELPVGIRFTLNKLNYKSLPKVLDLLVVEDIPRFCLYHLVYSGRASSAMDIDKDTRRQVIDLLIEKTFEYAEKDVEILSVDNPCDGIYLYQQIISRNPERQEEVLKELMFRHGKCSAGERIMNISPSGDVYACQFWNTRSLGNIRETALEQIWTDKSCYLLCNLRQREEKLKGKCGTCSYKSICGGCRLRAEAVYDDMWQEDPSCFLSQDQVRDPDSEEKIRRIAGSENALR